MDTDSIISVINLVNIITFFTALTVSIVTLTLRYFRYRKAGKPVPVLLPRDFILLAGLMASLGSIFLVRLLGVQGLGQNILWVAFTGGAASVSMVTWAVYEVLVIERKR